MPGRWSITAEWAPLESGSPEEMAGFAALGISACGSWLTEGHDKISWRVQQSPFLSAYHFAEWLAWNWWRLRWEPQKTSSDWALSHCLASIGSGYIWPNIQMISDGENMVLMSRPTQARVRTPFRYINDSVGLIPVAEFEGEVDSFVGMVLQRLRDRDIVESNLGNIWSAVVDERNDPHLSQRRKLEALLGEDPGEVDADALQRLIAEADRTGMAALEEIAADHPGGSAFPAVGDLLRAGQESGFDVRAQDRVRLSEPLRPDLSGLVPAWKIGVRAARALRAQSGLGEGPLANGLLADMFGASAIALDGTAEAALQSGLSFAISRAGSPDCVHLRSRWETGRRFEMARLLGDYLIADIDEPMRPATRAYTYRQKAQRAFAAELLSPLDAVEAMLGDELSMESQQDVAHYFNVSELTIRSLLVNHGHIDRSELVDRSVASD
jgi:hypothetical protein